MHPVKCLYCGIKFDRDKISCVQVPGKGRRYAHKDCYDKAFCQNEKEQQDKQELEDYIFKLFGYTTLPVRVNKQIQKFHTENNFSYSGMKKSLIYFFEIKKNSIEKANGGIGIVPYIYEEARTYWFRIYEAQDRNRNIRVEEYDLPIKEVHILPPKREPMKHTRKLFNFLEEAED